MPPDLTPELSPAPAPAPAAVPDRLAWLFRRAGQNQAAAALLAALRRLRETGHA